MQGFMLLPRLILMQIRSGRGSIEYSITTGSINAQEARRLETFPAALPHAGQNSAQVHICSDAYQDDSIPTSIATSQKRHI